MKLIFYYVPFVHFWLCFSIMIHLATLTCQAKDTCKSPHNTTWQAQEHDLLTGVTWQMPVWWARKSWSLRGSKTVMNEDHHTHHLLESLRKKLLSSCHWVCSSDCMNSFYRICKYAFLTHYIMLWIWRVIISKVHVLCVGAIISSITSFFKLTLV